ncbi:3457_t:CDS:2, partial [Acaulospora colombiana]
MSKENVWVDKLEDINPKYRSKYEKSLWPPSNVNNLNLERCMRIYPHFQDTGGFFIAVLQKTGPITDISPVDDSPSTNKDDTTGGASVTFDDDHKGVEETEDTDNEELDIATYDDVNEDSEDKDNDVADHTHRKRSRIYSSDGDLNKRAKTKELKDSNIDQSTPQRKGGEEPFILLELDNEDIPIIKEYYGLSEKFPTDQLLVRSTNEKNRTMYLVSESVKRVLEASDSKRLKVVNTGIRTFTRQETNEAIKCEFRFNSEGMSTIYPFISNRRVVEFELEDLKILLSEPTPLIERFDEKIKTRLKEL